MAKLGKQTFGWAHMFRDVLIESMRKGQLPLLAFAAIFGLILWKTPSDYYPTLWQKVFELKGSIMSGSLALNLILTLGWFFNARSLRKKFRDENARLIEERNELQKSSGIPIKSSRSR